MGKDKNWPASDAIGPAAEDGSEEKLEEGVGGPDEGEVELVMNAKELAVELLIGKNDAEADEIDEYYKEDREKGGFAHAAA